MPIGVSLPSPVAPTDVGSLKVAFARYKEILKAGRMPNGTKTAALLHSKNYYLWAMGTWARAKRANQNAVRWWLSDLATPPGASQRQFSPRRAYWIVHCLRHVVTVQLRPQATELTAAMANYLRCLAAPRVIGYQGWP